MDASQSIKLISLNIEGSKHFDRILPFLDGERLDVFCVQEVFARNLEMLRKHAGKNSVFLPLSSMPFEGGPRDGWGQAIFTDLPILASGTEYYYGTEDVLPDYIHHDTTSIRRAVSWIKIEKEGAEFTVANTHFTWTPNGEADENQRRDMPLLLNVLKGLDDFILCGDFNAPRGGEMFSALAEIYKDNIPPEYDSSIDSSLHRSGGLPYMVDGLFTTPQYATQDTKLVEGVSDHKAIISGISRKAPQN